MLSGGNGRTAAPARAAPPPVAPPRTAGAPPSHTDITSSGSGYGSAQANAYKATPAYHQAVAAVFKAQPTQQKAAIIKGLQRPAMRNTPEFQAVSKVAAGLTSNEQALIGKYLKMPSVFSGVEKGLGSAGSFLERGFKGMYGAGTPVQGSKVSAQEGAGLPGMGTVLPFGGSKGVTQIASNIGKDAWNLPGGTVEGLTAIGKNLVQGHVGNAFSELVDPYIHLVEHPAQSFYQHPLNSALMAMGPKALIGRGLGGIARSGALGDSAAQAASTVRAPLSIGTIAGEPSPITEARNFSSDVLNQAFQKGRDSLLRKRGQDPNVSRPAPSILPPKAAYAMNVGTRAKLYRGTDEMTAVHQMEHRSARTQATVDLQKAAPPKVSGNVVSHVLQGVLRTPKTAVEDAVKEINRLKAAQTGKRTVGEIWNRNQVRDLSTALKTPGALDQAFKTAAQIRPQLHTQDAYLVQHALLDGEQAARRSVLPYATAHMGAKYDPITATFTKADGTPLSTQAIFDHLKQNGVPDPAYVGHFPGKVSPARFYSAYKLARGTLGGNKGFTGAAFRAGAYDHTWNGLVGQVASRAQAVAKASLHDRVISRYGVTIPQHILAQLGIKSENGNFTPAEARAIARAAMVDDHGNPVPNALELTGISRAPANVLGQVRDLQHPQELGNISQLELQALAHAVEDAAQRTDGTRNVTLVPSDVTQRFGQQYAKTDSLLKSVGRVTQQFRRTVLPYSTHWMTQIGSEAALRAMIAGVLNPRDLLDGRALSKYLSSKEGSPQLAEMVNGTMYSGGGSGVLNALKGQAGRGNLDIHNPNAGMLASGAKAFPPSRLLIAAHNRYADTVTAGMYSLEHNARLMGLGHLAHKEVQSFGFSWSNAVRLQGKAIGQLGDKLKNDPALVAKFGREIDNTFGKYNKFTPTQRAMIQSFMPFLPWYLNAAKYVMWHLPAHHPVSSSLLASLRQTVNQDIADGKKLPLNTYAMQELGRISPFGWFTPTSTIPSTGAALAGQQITGAFLPQIEGSLYNLIGQSSFGNTALKQAPTAANYTGDVHPLSGPAAAAAAENLIESLVPLVRYARLAEEGGRPAYGTSTIVSPQPKPGGGTGTTGQILNRIFNPFYATERAQTAGPAYGPKPPLSSGSSSGNYLLGGSSGSSTGGYLLGSGGSSSGGYLLP